ncbi:MAG: L-threonylcarbamoyladenylate synthase [Candidatus Microthrix parvicella]
MARLIRLRPGAGAIDGRAVDALVEAVDSGQVVLMPTDTVYGLAATASRAGIESLARIKGRDAGKPVAVLVATPGQGLALFDQPHQGLVRVAKAGWPGPLTLVAAAGAGAPTGMSSNGTIGVRCPDHELVRRLTERVGPIAVTSANPAGGEPLCDLRNWGELAKVWPEARSIDCLVDGGPLPGTASTVVDGSAEPSGMPRLLRAGPIEFDRIVSWWLQVPEDTP